MQDKKTKMIKKRKIRYDRIFVFLFIVSIFIGFFVFIFNIKISNIYIKNNNLLTDQEIIEIAKLSDYPSTLKNLSVQIENNLEKNIYIKDAKVSKKFLTKVYIEVEENNPIFYYNHTNKTILQDGVSVDKKFNVPTVLNYIVDTYYDDFIREMSKLDKDILSRISEIQFKPTEVDDNRFLLLMNDDNYVYININTFYKLNKYLSIKEGLPNQKGILYLDYGNNFEIIK